MADEAPSRVTQDHVVQMAIRMEELGRDFYEALGGAARDPQVFQLCHRLAADEDRHREVFCRLQTELASRGTPMLLTDEQTIVARRRLNDQVMPTSETIRQIACGGNVIEALTMAVRMAAEAVRFYTHIAAKLPAGNAIEAVIAEERAHIRFLLAVRCGVATGQPTADMNATDKA